MQQEDDLRGSENLDLGKPLENLQKKQEGAHNHLRKSEDHSLEVLTNDENKSNQGQGYLPAYTSPCRLESSQALSAIGRAKSKECKQEIADIACGIQEGGVYPGSLPNTCHLKGKILFRCPWFYLLHISYITNWFTGRSHLLIDQNIYMRYRHRKWSYLFGEMGRGSRNKKIQHSIKTYPV